MEKHQVAAQADDSHITLAVTLMQHSGMLAWIATWINPLFVHFGLLGESAVTFISGATAGTYAGIAAMMSIPLTMKQASILALMVVQRMLEAYRLLDPLSRILSPLMSIFGLPRQASYMWLVGNYNHITARAIYIERFMYFFPFRMKISPFFMLLFFLPCRSYIVLFCGQFTLGMFSPLVPSFRKSAAENTHLPLS